MKLITILLSTLFIQLFVYADTISAKYTITYGGFLDLGEAYTTLSTKDNKYTIKIEAKTTGMAKYLTNNRIEVYESHGDFINNKFYPQRFVKIKKDNYKQRIRTYTIDKKNKQVLLNDIKKGIKIKIQSDLSKKEVKFYKEQNSKLDYFANDDILSLFFNLHKNIQNFKNGKEYRLKAIGANKTTGLINILVPSKEKMKTLDETLKIESKKKFIAYINQDIFSSKRGELMISLDNNGFCNKAVLKDVLLFGDITGKMIELKTLKDTNDANEKI